ncbi:MAG: ABC-F type ribosomal protection protein [Bacilli bacterium]|nr:ABC-F type ribosomal protection protein [Bacilli bacterium]
MYYKISNGSVTLGANTILEDINFYVKDNDKIGIVGRNGCGKTTLLKAITNEYTLSDGYDDLKIESSNDFKIGCVKQNITDNLNMKMIDYIKESYSDILEIENKLNSLEQKLSNSYSEQVLNKYNDLQNEYIYKGGNTYKKEYEIALKKFGFTDIDKEKLLNEFSGGQLTKLSLIRLLLSKPDLLILDEPTNHLDINSIEWLENYLKNYKKSIILVSHDRMFLDNICNIIYDIEYGELKRYVGNYSSFVKQKEQDYEKQLKDYEYQQKEIKRLQYIADRFRYKPTKAKMAMSKLKQIEKMIKIDKPNKSNTKTFKINLKTEENSYRDVLKVKNLSIGYDKELCKLSFNLERQDKLGIIGENGIGKSTLIKTLTGLIHPLSGKYIYGDRVSIGYFSQNFENLDNNNTVYEEIDKAYPSMTPNEIRTLLGSFEFTGEDVFKKINDLSGGEKVKLSLCKILNNKPNLLILDEPTNHLDIISKDTIEKILTNYNGTIIMVSHDRYLINNVCNKLLVFENNEAKLYNYGYKEYLEKRKVDIPILKEEPKKDKNKVINNSVDNTNKLNKIMKEIELLDNDLKKLNNKLLEKEVYMNVAKAKEIEQEILNITNKIEEKTNEWESLANKVE